MAKFDIINKPVHYNDHPSGIEAVDLTMLFSTLSGNAVKYVWRHGSKESSLADRKKALWYVREAIFQCEAWHKSGKLSVFPVVLPGFSSTVYGMMQRVAETCGDDATTGLLARVASAFVARYQYHFTMVGIEPEMLSWLRDFEALLVQDLGPAVAATVRRPR
jgi:hypothetical protein